MNHSFLKSPLGDSPVIMEAEFKASVSRLFQAWINAEDIKKWFGAGEGGPDQASIDFKVDGKWRFVFIREDEQQDILSGRYLVIEQDEKIVFSWVHTRILVDGKEEVSAESTVTLTFESRGQGSFLRLVHESISSDGVRTNIGGGWNASITKIKALIE